MEGLGHVMEALSLSWKVLVMSWYLRFMSWKLSLGLTSQVAPIAHMPAVFSDALNIPHQTYTANIPCDHDITHM